MHIAYRLSTKFREKLKVPIGILIKDSFNSVINEIIDEDGNRNLFIIAVGDVVTKKFHKRGIYPKLSIVDNLVMRKEIKPIAIDTEITIYIENPPGCITREAIEEIKKALKTNHTTKLVVKGEEDLLALIAILYAPENSFVVYGQPKIGVVIVKVTKEKKNGNSRNTERNGKCVERLNKRMKHQYQLNL